MKRGDREPSPVSVLDVSKWLIRYFVLNMRASVTLQRHVFLLY